MSTTAQNIIQYIQHSQQATVAELVEQFQVSRQVVHRQLKKFVDNGALSKVGKPPKVFYVLQNGHEMPEHVAEGLLQNAWQNWINQEFFQITPDGQIKQGIDAFIYWCQKRNLPIEKTAGEYIETLKKYHQYKNTDGLIDGTRKIKSSFDVNYLDEIYYLDFYSIERFGKTKLGQMLLYAKLSQNKALINDIIMMVKPKIDQLILEKNIDAIGFIPPTLKREVQLMHVLAKGLHLNKEILSLTKVSTSDIPIPQKSLSKLEDRVDNAENTILITDHKVFNNILLIDDAVGSGATLNVTAKKIRAKGLCTGKIIGLALTGSYKGFDVISEV